MLCIPGKIYHCLFSYCLDKNDRKEESEEEIWDGDDQQESPVVSKHSSSKANCSLHTSLETSLMEPEEDYGGSTEVDEVDTDDEINT